MTRNRGVIKFSAKQSELSADLKVMECVECEAPVGEVDAWYGIKCACGDLVVPGYQILKVGSHVMC